MRLPHLLSSLPLEANPCDTVLRPQTNTFRKWREKQAKPISCALQWPAVVLQLTEQVLGDARLTRQKKPNLANEMVNGWKHGFGNQSWGDRVLFGAFRHQQARCGFAVG